MKIYVAAKWEEKDYAKAIMQELQGFGHTITYDWTVCAVADRAQAALDVLGVQSAEAFVGIFEENLPYQGAIAEFGMAVARGIPCYLLGHAIDGCIFTKLPNVHYGIGSLLEASCPT